MTVIKNTIKKELATQIEISDSNNNLGTSWGLEIVDTQKTSNKDKIKK
jgi:hypothetical protein